MKQLRLPGTDNPKRHEIVGRKARVQRLLDLFFQKPNEWIRSTSLEKVGGRCGWRTRVSECRRVHGLNIENHLLRDGDEVISEYRYVPETIAA